MSLEIVRSRNRNPMGLHQFSSRNQNLRQERKFNDIQRKGETLKTQGGRESEPDGGGEEEEELEEGCEM